MFSKSLKNNLTIAGQYNYGLGVFLLQVSFLSLSLSLSQQQHLTESSSMPNQVIFFLVTFQQFWADLKSLFLCFRKQQ